MSFKEWLQNEDAAAAAGELGNQHDPDENGLKRANWMRRPVPDSELANRLFGRKFMDDDVFRFDPQGNINPELLRQIEIIRRDPRFEKFGDDQIESMLLHHTPEEILKHGPEKSLERHQDFSMADMMGVDLPHAAWD